MGIDGGPGALARGSSPSATPAGGLSTPAAATALHADGPNELPASQPRSLLRLAREVAAEPMFLLLVACGASYLVLGDRQEALMLLGFVFVVMGTSFVQQRRSERSLDALRDLSSPRALVLRDGAAVSLPARELVLGDVIWLAEGDRVPADVVLLQASNFSVDESLLTGESVPVNKAALVEGGSAGGAAPPAAAVDAKAWSQARKESSMSGSGQTRVLGPRDNSPPACRGR
jgi:Ca2+-transporting ATPase